MASGCTTFDAGIKRTVQEAKAMYNRTPAMTFFAFLSPCCLLRRGFWQFYVRRKKRLWTLSLDNQIETPLERPCDEVRSVPGAQTRTSRHGSKASELINLILDSVTNVSCRTRLTRLYALTKFLLDPDLRLLVGLPMSSLLFFSLYFLKTMTRSEFWSDPS